MFDYAPLTISLNALMFIVNENELKHNPSVSKSFVGLNLRRVGGGEQSEDAVGENIYDMLPS